MKALVAQLKEQLVTAQAAGGDGSGGGGDGGGGGGGAAPDPVAAAAAMQTLIDMESQMAAKVGRCRLTVFKPVFKRPVVSALETII
jgi:hypothetical protein